MALNWNTFTESKKLARRETASPVSAAAALDKHRRFAIGDRVRHASLGEGVIAECPAGDGAVICTVKFHHRKMRILSSHLHR